MQEFYGEILVYKFPLQIKFVFLGMYKLSAVYSIFFLFFIFERVDYVTWVQPAKVALICLVGNFV
jgi:hypothetical protein